MIRTLVTNSKLERLSGYETDIWRLAKTYPSLKHWGFGIFNGDFVGIEYDNEVTMPSIQSVAIECEKYCSGHALHFHHLNILFKAFPNLLAVRVNCSPFENTEYEYEYEYQYQYDHDHDHDLLLAVLAECPQLAVLEISAQPKLDTESYLKLIRRRLKNQEVFILPYTYTFEISSSDLVKDIIENLPN